MKKLKDYRFLTDENIDPSLVTFLRENHFDIFDVKENNLHGSSDDLLLELASNTNRVIITLDSDFGTLIHREGFHFHGIIYLKPGHFETRFHLMTFNELIKLNQNYETPFMVIAAWGEKGIKIRIKNAMNLL